MPILKHIDFEVPGFGELASPPIGVPQYAQGVLDLSPTAYWRMDELSGTTLADEVGAAPLSLTSSYSLGQPGALLTGSTHAIRFTTGRARSSNAVLPTAAGAPYTLAFWLRVPVAVTQNMPFMGQYVAGQTGRNVLTLLTSGVVRYVTNGNPTIETASNFGEGWRMLVFSFDASGNMNCYVDGKFDTQSSGHTVGVVDTTFRIGRVLSAVPDVVVDQCAVFDRDITQDEALWLYGLGVGRLQHVPSE